MALTSITRVDQQSNVPGTKLKITINTMDKVTTPPEFATDSSDATAVQIVTDIVFSVPAVQFEFEPLTGKVSGSKKGGHHELVYEGKIFIPNSAGGLSAKANLKRLTNARIIALVPLQNGVNLLGGETYDRPAKMTEVNPDSMKVGEDGTVEAEVKFVWYSEVPGGAEHTGEFPIA